MRNRTIEAVSRCEEGTFELRAFQTTNRVQRAGSRRVGRLHDCTASGLRGVKFLNRSTICRTLFGNHPADLDINTNLVPQVQHPVDLMLSHLFPLRFHFDE